MLNRVILILFIAYLCHMETWAKVRDFEGYEVSNMGRVKSLGREILTKKGWTRFSPERILKPSKTGYEGRYLFVQLGRGNARYVHRLVWEAFNEKIPKGLTIDHINIDSLDNRLENLRLFTPRQQSQNVKNKHVGVRKNGKGYRKPYSAIYYVSPKSYKVIGHYWTKEEASKARTEYLLEKNLL